jgi:hypothetical protein
MSQNQNPSSNLAQQPEILELSDEQLEALAAGSWAGVAAGAGTIGLAASAAAAFPGTWAVPFAGAAMVATATAMGGVAIMAGYFASL